MRMEEKGIVGLARVGVVYSRFESWGREEALGWLLEEIHVSWAHLEKKRTRLQLYTKVIEEYGSQWLETASQFHVTASGYQSEGVRI
nr:hypothetical protein [Tanacetum cinerariifolium]